METEFLKNENINILYEILLQELKVDESSIWIKNIKKIFSNNINFFVENVNLNSSLLELNKLFLKQTIIAINKLVPNLRNNKKINILPEEINFPHKIEDIKNIRKDLFDEELNMKRMDFDNMMKRDKPEMIDFTYKLSNEKIVDMEKVLSEKINERDNDLQLLEKNTMMNENVSIGENIKMEFQEKYKKKVEFNSKENDEIIPEIKYDEQKSIELPKIQNYKNNYLLKESDIVEKMPNKMSTNELDILNKKIDHLTELVEQLIRLQTQTQQHELPQKHTQQLD
jgi:hypothetical protein